MLNTGQVQSIHDINISVQAVRAHASEEVAQGLEELTRAIASADDLDEAGKSAALDHMREISRQAALPKEKRSSAAVLGSLWQGLSSLLATAASVAKVWSVWGDKLMAYFGS
jgi:methyl-accepting chemotaxis protein